MKLWRIKHLTYHQSSQLPNDLKLKGIWRQCVTSHNKHDHTNFFENENCKVICKTLRLPQPRSTAAQPLTTTMPQPFFQGDNTHLNANVVNIVAGSQFNYQNQGLQLLLFRPQLHNWYRILQSALNWRSYADRISKPFAAMSMLSVLPIPGGCFFTISSSGLQMKTRSVFCGFTEEQVWGNRRSPTR